MNTRFYLQKQPKGTYLMVDVTGNGMERVRVSTGISLTAEEWDDTKNRIKGSDMQAHLDNKKLSDIRSTIDDLPITYAKIGLTKEIVKLNLMNVHYQKRKKSTLNNCEVKIVKKN
jgi:hypothetical protein